MDIIKTSQQKPAKVFEAPEEIVVTGCLPGPPLWKVSNGDKVLWIFPHLEWIPNDMLDEGLQDETSGEDMTPC